MTVGYINTAHALLLAPTAATKFDGEACRMCVTRLSFCSRSASAFLQDSVQCKPYAYANGFTGMCLMLQQGRRSYPPLILVAATTTNAGDQIETGNALEAHFAHSLLLNGRDPITPCICKSHMRLAQDNYRTSFGFTCPHRQHPTIHHPLHNVADMSQQQLSS